MWMPVRHDGIFFTENAEEKLKSGKVPNDINYIIGTNSYEGTLFLMAERPDWNLKYQNISIVFDYIQGYHEGEPQISVHDGDIDPKYYDEIVETYFNIYKDFLQVRPGHCRKKYKYAERQKSPKFRFYPVLLRPKARRKFPYLITPRLERPNKDPNVARVHYRPYWAHLGSLLIQYIKARLRKPSRAFISVI